MVMAEGTAVLRRNRPGTKAQDFYNWPDESFDEMDSTLAVQQFYLFLREMESVYTDMEGGGAESERKKRESQAGSVSAQSPYGA
uniref:Uncharacterized protein n=1 Tax=Felis catus TaxID=9685 RepID=A0ABI7YC63_FELCA